MTRIFVCRTCPRNEARPRGAPGLGAEFGERMKVLAAQEAGLTVLQLNCLAGCPNPCNAAIDDDGKMRLRFSRLAVADLPDLLAVAALHAASPDGNLDEADLPASLRGKLTARSPARLKS